MENEDPHKRMRRFGELCGYFYGRRFFGLETIMSDRDSDHMLLELQEARAEIDRLRDQLRWRKWPEESPTETGYYIVWKFNLSYTPNGFYSVNSDSWDVMWKRFYWMPQMPLPEVES